MKIHLLAALSLICCASLSARAEDPKYPLVFSEDFEKGAEKWKPNDPAGWRVDDEPGHGKVYHQFKKESAYKPKYRSPFNISILKDEKVSDFVLEADCQSTIKDYGHRDMCIAFGYQSPEQFYYVHLGKKTDDHCNQIFIVNKAERTKISVKTTAGTPWTDDWQHVKVVRNVATGAIEIFFNDMQTPCMTAKDTTFAWGGIGVGTFDDTGKWDNVKLYGLKYAEK